MAGYNQLCCANSFPYLRNMLLNEVDQLCRKDLPYQEILEVIRKEGWEAVFMGGVPRVLLGSRLYRMQEGSPRDLDIVVKGISTNTLEARFSKWASSKNRFGGLKLQTGKQHIDIWSLDNTYNIKYNEQTGAVFSDLISIPWTSLEAIAVSVLPDCESGLRSIYAGSGQFFRTMDSRVVTLNNHETPYSELSAVRLLITAYEEGWYLDPDMARAVVKAGGNLTCLDIDRIQKKHYGFMRYMGSTVVGWIDGISKLLQCSGITDFVDLTTLNTISTLGPLECSLPSFGIQGDPDIVF